MDKNECNEAPETRLRIREPSPGDTVNLVERETSPNGVALVDPNRSGKRGAYDLVELAANIEKADQFTKANAGSKLTVIAEQVRFLQEQAHRVLEDANLSAKLHHIACNFKKIPGKTYYVYKNKETGKEYMSMISPEEWGATCPPFVAGYRLEHDHSWTPVGNVEEKNTANEMIDKILRANAAGSKLQLTFGN